MKSEYPLEQSNALNQEVKPLQPQGKQLKRGSKQSNGKLAWQAKVYKINPDESQALNEFHSVCNAVFGRDGNICRSCFRTKYKLSRESLFLTAHHIISRESGGTNDMDNLLSLCNECHDKIEELNLKSRSEIEGYFTTDKKHWSREENIGIRWQQWVYGGYQKPTRNNPK